MMAHTSINISDWYDVCQQC